MSSAEYTDQGFEMDVGWWKERCQTLKTTIKLLEEDRDFWHLQALTFQTKHAELRDKVQAERDEKIRKADEAIKKAEENELRAKNAKQVLYCDWDDYSSFSIPEGVDLKDTKNVTWWVRWGTLHIQTRDGKTYELEATDAPSLKVPEECRLVDNDGEEELIAPNTEFESDSEDSEEESDDSATGEN